MARDPRKGSAFDSGMRGREKPKIADAHGKTAAAVGTSAGNEKQQAGGRIGDNTGVDLSAYTSGMRGPEKPKQKSAQQGRGVGGDAGYGQTEHSAGGGESHQKANTTIGNPDGDNTAATGARKGIQDSHLQSVAHTARNEMGIPGNNTEQAAIGQPGEGEPGILGDEDDTHINLRIPKASLKKKNPGLQVG